MSASNDSQGRSGRGGVSSAPLGSLAAETLATEPSRVAAPALRSDRPADQSPGDDAAAGAGPASDCRLREARERADRYLAELIEEVGEPSPEEAAEAEAWAARIERALEEARAAQ